MFSSFQFTQSYIEYFYRLQNVLHRQDRVGEYSVLEIFALLLRIFALVHALHLLDNRRFSRLSGACAIINLAAVASMLGRLPNKRILISRSITLPSVFS